jgi:hypothetical protein
MAKDQLPYGWFQNPELMHIYEQNGVILFKDLKHVLPQFKQNTLKCETVLFFGFFFFFLIRIRSFNWISFFHTNLLFQCLLFFGPWTFNSLILVNFNFFLLIYFNFAYDWIAICPLISPFLSFQSLVLQFFIF